MQDLCVPVEMCAARPDRENNGLKRVDFDRATPCANNGLFLSAATKSRRPERSVGAKEVVAFATWAPTGERTAADRSKSESGKWVRDGQASRRDLHR